ncbi:hypothetical protein ACIQNU_25655 [Streptomyces sp. NPDC091292]|uniref:hypothetical protein n=1 Tax=Streptomyces sp. NPDC091292 TaxID=3365991 RepID=UPI00381935D7
MPSSVPGATDIGESPDPPEDPIWPWRRVTSSGFELLPGGGLLLPFGAGALRFGMGEREARWAVATIADVREMWVCRARWGLWAEVWGIEVTAWGADGGGDGNGDDPSRGGLDHVRLARAVDAPLDPAAVPVVRLGVDLFGHEQDEVLRALGTDGARGLRIEPSAGAFLRAVSLSARSGPARDDQ